MQKQFPVQKLIPQPAVKRFDIAILPRAAGMLGLDRIRRVEELKEFGKDGGMLIGSTGQIHPACKLENLLAMIETAHARKTKTSRIQTIPPKRIREMDHEVLR